MVPTARLSRRTQRRESGCESPVHGRQVGASGAGGCSSNRARTSARSCSRLLARRCGSPASASLSVIRSSAVATRNRNPSASTMLLHGRPPLRCQHLQRKIAPPHGLREVRRLVPANCRCGHGDRYTRSPLPTTPPAARRRSGALRHRYRACCVAPPCATARPRHQSKHTAQPPARAHSP